LDTDLVDILIRHPVPRRRLTDLGYRHIGQVGILGDGDRVELLEGQLDRFGLTTIAPRSDCSPNHSASVNDAEVVV
jgi:hypothetical protein